MAEHEDEIDTGVENQGGRAHFFGTQRSRSALQPSRKIANSAALASSVIFECFSIELHNLRIAPR